MKKFRGPIVEIYREHRGLFIMMIFLAVLAIAFLIFSLVTLSPSSAIVKVGYSDIGSFAGGFHKEFFEFHCRQAQFAKPIDRKYVAGAVF